VQRLDRESQFGFLGALDTAFQARQPIRLGLISHGGPDCPTATFGLVSSDISIGYQQLIEELTALDDAPPGWRWQPLQLGEADGPRGIALQIPPRTRVLICGAGPDAVPMVAALAALDWEVLVADHRPAFARAERFAQGCSILQVRPEKLHTVLEPGSLDGAVIMSHHLENDAAYLAQLAPAGLAYIGVLGPRARRDRLMQMADCDRAAVFGPVGLDVGAELPAAIALAVAAEIHAVLNGRDGTPLTRLTDDERDS
jgi:xanthine/CO dehydrogenase XdhC/CoxF family maturation factor